MSLPALDKLAGVGQLKAEPHNEAEVRRLVVMARTRLDDAQLPAASIEGRFTSAYNAAHSAALAALRKRNLAEYEGFLEVEESAITNCAQWWRL